ncbi:MAG: hypothetical protein ACKO5F_12595 [Synechococcus sp.]
MAEQSGRLVIVEPAYASTVGHHGEVNRPLLAALAAEGWKAELWADVALEAEVGAPQPLRGVFSGCGYEDPRHWRELGGMLQLARRLEQQLSEAARHGAQPTAAPITAWLAHSLLPFQLLGLARHLAQAAPAQVLISLMFAPGETLEGEGPCEQASHNARVALAALAKAAARQGHRLQLVFPSRQQQLLYRPLLKATGLRDGGLHPAVVGGGCRPDAPQAEEPPLVLLHWGDQKVGKGQEEALTVLQALLQEGVPEPLAGWGWLWHQHSRASHNAQAEAVLQQAEAAGLPLVRLQGEVESAAMQGWLARCPLALLAYHPARYSQRSSGMLWQWAAGRWALQQPAAAVGYSSGWLAAEAAELGLRWHGLPWREALTQDGERWRQALAAAAAALPAAQCWSAASEPVLGRSFGRWCAEQLRGAGPT